MQYLSLQELLLLHARLIQRTGGSPGVRDMGLLESALAPPQATFDDTDLSPDSCHKGAALLHALCQYYPFVDGNKRVALAATGILLELNGHALTAGNDEAVSLLRRVATGAAQVTEIAAWLQSHSRHMPGV
jgi:death-on-curing protein